jgi:hypothetical protein
VNEILKGCCVVMDEETTAVICDSQFAFALSVECAMLLCSHMCVMEQVNWLV